MVIYLNEYVWKQKSDNMMRTVGVDTVKSRQKDVTV